MELSSLRSTFRIFPRSGRIAWNLRSRACLALPPALSPSTRKISVRSMSVEEQSASFPGSIDDRSTLLRRTSSRARFAASAAFMAWRALEAMAARTSWWVMKASLSSSATTESTIFRTSGFPSRVFVCPSNSGLGTFTDTMQLRPSRTFSPLKLESASLRCLKLRARVFTVRVRATFMPSMCVPPSTVRMQFAYPSSVSE
mmetsp:Transcript_23340/g.51045  ORF Transcript_23340/g.51045 Transcript_23340/m.51045 type:complete len:200 (-) Transcript_23340:211-810(-)